MLSTVQETAETALGEQALFIKVLTLGVMAIIALYWVYYQIKNH